LVDAHNPVVCYEEGRERINRGVRTPRRRAVHPRSFEKGIVVACWTDEMLSFVSPDDRPVVSTTRGVGRGVAPGVTLVA
jgi:hypothetical protein